jgi:hypothetical protein
LSHLNLVSIFPLTENIQFSNDTFLLNPPLKLETFRVVSPSQTLF